MIQFLSDLVLRLIDALICFANRFVFFAHILLGTRVGARGDGICAVEFCVGIV